MTSTSSFCDQFSFKRLWHFFLTLSMYYTHKKIIIEYSVFYWLILSLLSQTKVTTSIFSCCNISILVCDFFVKSFEFLNTRAVLCYAYVVKYLCKCMVGTFIYIYFFFVDCVTQNRLLSMDSYLLGRPKRESSPEYWLFICKNFPVLPVLMTQP